MTHEQNIENDMLLAQNSVDMKKYKRIKPDHFIEIYGNNRNSFYTEYNSIKHLKNYLKKTKETSFKTIAIFKIKLK